MNGKNGFTLDPAELAGWGERYTALAREAHLRGHSGDVVTNMEAGVGFYALRSWAALAEGDRGKVDHETRSLGAELTAAQIVIEKFDSLHAPARLWELAWRVCVTSVLADCHAGWDRAVEILRESADAGKNERSFKTGLIEVEVLRRGGMLREASHALWALDWERAPPSSTLAQLIHARIYRDLGWMEMANDAYESILATADAPRVLVAVAMRERESRLRGAHMSDEE